MLLQGETQVRRIPQKWLVVSHVQASALQKAITLIPSDVEVVASYGIIGRFSERKYIYELAAPYQHFPVQASPVYFVITPTAGYETLDGPDAMADVRFVQVRLHASTVIDSNGVWVLKWLPPSNVTSVLLPGLKGASPTCRQC